MTTTSTSLTLAGLIIDLVGAFILSVEAIGIDRVQAWGDALRLFPNAPRAAGSSTFTDPRRILSGVLGGFGSAVGYWTYQYVAKHFATGVAVQMASAVLGAIAGMAGSLVVLAGCRAMALFLLHAQARARRQSAGTLGFAFLAIGFALQFAGTLMSALISN